MLSASRVRLPLTVSALLLGSACGGPGPYGHSVHYASTKEERAALEGARDFDPVMYAREPDRWRLGKTTLVGVVTARKLGPGGGAYVTLSVRRFEPRNLCTSANDEDSCRVTVSDREFGVVHAVVSLPAEDDAGERAVAPGSLLRVVGAFANEADAEDQAPVLRASFYRHWPRHHFVTRASADVMRQ